MTSTNLKPVSEPELWVPRLRWGVRLSRLELIPHSLRAERLAVERVGLGRCVDGAGGVGRRACAEHRRVSAGEGVGQSAP